MLFAGQGRLKRRVSDLERELEMLRGRPLVQAPVTPATFSAPSPLPISTPAPPKEAPGDAPGLEEVATGLPDDAQVPARPEVLVSEEAATDQNRPIVLRPDRIEALVGWLRENWIYVVSGISLAAAGVFLVQWGAERGLISPAMRVLAALALGGALILGGERIRRRGSDEVGATAYLPSVFSGAGIVVLFAAVTAARQLYGLVGPTPTFAGLFSVAALAVALGWRHGPLLAALGLVGATAAPFLIDAPSGPADLLHPYFLLVAVIGLGIDAVRRWAWVSVLALALSFGAGLLLQASGSAGPMLWAVQLVALPLIAAALPDLAWRPVQGGVTVSEFVMLRGTADWPGFPTRLAAGSLLAASVLLAVFPASGEADPAAWAALTVLALAFALWAAPSVGMADLAALPTAAFLARLGVQSWSGDGVFWPILPSDAPEGAVAGAQPMVWAILAAAILISAAFCWRALRSSGGGRGFGVVWGLAATGLPTTSLVWLEMVWRGTVPGLAPFAWAGVVMAHAAAATLLALTFARADGEDRRRAAHAGLAALTLVALSLFVVTTGAPLTMALAVLIAAAAMLDRRFDLPEFGLFVQAGVAVLLYRLVADPGLIWSLEGRLWMVVLAHGAALASIAFAWTALSARNRLLTRLVLESSGATILALSLAIAITRWLVRDGTEADLVTSWGVSLNALPWLALMLSQLYRMRPDQWGNGLRAAIATVSGLAGLALVAISATVLNPALDSGQTVIGGPVLDTLLVAYILPGLLLLAGSWVVPHIPKAVKAALTSVGVALVVLYAALEIRYWWRGPDLSVPGVTQPELYSYTLAMMVTGAALLWQAIARRSAGMRRLAMAVIALTVAKVFLIDASGLTGLVRVVSFLGLGLTLAGLAWLNRWATGAAQRD